LEALNYISSEVLMLIRGGKRASPARFGPARMWPVKKWAEPGWPVKQKRVNSHNLSRIGRAKGLGRAGPSIFFNFFN